MRRPGRSTLGLFGRHDGARALHAKGTWCSGTFTATPAASGPIRFTLEARIADDGDDVHDPSSAWPSARRIDAGALELIAIGPNAEEDGSVLVFDPVRVTDGVEPSEDPILLYRPKAYAESVERRA